MVENPFEAAGDTGGCAEDAARRGGGSLNIRHSVEGLGYVRLCGVRLCGVRLCGVWLLLVLGSCFNFLLERFPGPFNDSLFGMVVVEFCCLEGLVVWW